MLRREDIVEILKKFGPPGERREEKISAIGFFGVVNFQNIKLEETLLSYKEF